MAEKRAKKALEDAKAAKINEEIRRKSGKVRALKLSIDMGSYFSGCWKVEGRNEIKGNH